MSPYIRVKLDHINNEYRADTYSPQFVHINMSGSNQHETQHPQYQQLLEVFCATLIRNASKSLYKPSLLVSISEIRPLGKQTLREMSSKDMKMSSVDCGKSAGVCDFSQVRGRF